MPLLDTLRQLNVSHDTRVGMVTIVFNIVDHHIRTIKRQGAGKKRMLFIFGH